MKIRSLPRIATFFHSTERYLPALSLTVDSISWKLWIKPAKISSHYQPKIQLYRMQDSIHAFLIPSRRTRKRARNNYPTALITPPSPLTDKNVYRKSKSLHLVICSTCPWHLWSTDHVRHISTERTRWCISVVSNNSVATAMLSFSLVIAK